MSVAPDMPQIDFVSSDNSTDCGFVHGQAMAEMIHESAEAIQQKLLGDLSVSTLVLHEWTH